MGLKVVAIALALLGTASSTEAGVWKAPQLPKARKLLEDCTPDGTFQQFFCENGVLKIGGGYTDDTCTSSPIWNIDYAAMMAQNGEEACNSMNATEWMGGSTPVSFTMGCVDDVPMMVLTASADCSGECVSALPLPAQMGGGCRPNTCDGDEGDVEGDDDEDDEDGLPTCLSTCPQPTSPDMCSYASGLIASADACVDACWGTEEEIKVKGLMASCGIVVPGNSGCALADSPPTASPTTVSPTTSPSSVSPTVSSTTVSPTVATTTSPTTLSPPALADAVLTPASGTGRMSATLGLCVGVAALVAALL